MKHNNNSNSKKCKLLCIFSIIIFVILPITYIILFYNYPKLRNKTNNNIYYSIILTISYMLTGFDIFLIISLFCIALVGIFET
jgi:hypothetical protein